MIDLLTTEVMKEGRFDQYSRNHIIQSFEKYLISNDGIFGKEQPDFKPEYIEKIHELMCPSDSSFNTIEFKNFFVISPSTIDKDQILKTYSNYFGEKGKKVPEDFEYRSDTNKDFLSDKEIKVLLKK